MTQALADIYVAVGSNIDPYRHVLAALVHLRRRLECVAISTFYRTPPAERPEQEDYRNGVFHLRAPHAQSAVDRDLLKPIEAALGRERTADRHAARTIDLDLTLYCVEGKARWADPELALRNFIAVPLAELAPDVVLPPWQRTTTEIASAMDRSALHPDDGLTQQLREMLEHE